MTVETLEGKELDGVFGTPSPQPSEEVKVIPQPVPVEPVGETQPDTTPRKVPGVPRLIPKQSPASPE
jgi:hypothetical protein